MSEFDPIRSYTDDEYRESVTRLMNDAGFVSAADSFLGEDGRRSVFADALRYRNANELQKGLILPMVQQFLQKLGSELSFRFNDIDCVSDRYVFISNHRDIVLDPSLLSTCLALSGANGVEIAIGDNLLISKWIEEFVRINKSFIVKRSLTSQSEFLEFSRLLSSYIHHVIGTRKDSVWIAQREGRAKDSNDLTQRSLLKMLSMSGGSGTLDSLKELHIVPLAISYEYDPCDWLKAMEFQLKRDNPDYRKTRENDRLNMATGIRGYKGRIHLQSAPCIDGLIDTVDQSKPRNIQLDEVAKIIDRGIHSSYRIYTSNRIALDLLSGGSSQRQYYTCEDKKVFENYLIKQLSNIDIPNPDWDFLRRKILEMYANPLINQLKASGISQELV